MRARHLVVLVAGLVLGIMSLAIAHRDPQAAIGGASIGADIALLAAGSALVTCGVVAWVRRPASRFGELLAAAGLAWFLVEFNNPGVGLAPLFTVGLVTYAACPAIVVHAALTYPGGILPGSFARIAVVAAYGSTVGALGLAPAVLADPATLGCSQCPHDVLAVTSLPGLAAASGRLGLGLGLVWTIGLIAVATYRLIRASPAARRITAPVLVTAAIYLALVAADYVHGLARGFLSNDDLDWQLWVGQAASLVALEAGVVAAWVRGARARSNVSRLIVQLGESPAVGGLRDTMAAALADPMLQLAYPLDGGRHVDATGQTMELRATPDRAVTPLLRGDRPIAVLVHRADLVDDVWLLDDVAAAARLALERERLQAEVRAQLEELRASRARSVETADTERKRLERNLHDGAQQRLVVLSLALRLLRGELTDSASERAELAEVELRGALAELRDLARGIYPAVLTDEGLAPAIEALAEQGSAPITISALPTERLAPAAEAAAYFLVAEVIKRGLTSAVNVRASHADGRLSVDIVSAGTLSDDLVDVEDRIGALDGALAVRHGVNGHTTIHAEIPCES